MLRKLAILAVLTITLILPLSVSSATIKEDSTERPYIDRLQYKVITSDDLAINALINDEIDMISEPIDPGFQAQLESAENIKIESVLRNGYGYVTINCAKYPFNITAFRRAVAFAVDKEAISENVWDGLSQPQDSVVPALNPWSVEEQLPYHYYKANVEQGNQLLDDAGFADVDSDGIREAPDGSEFNVVIECASSSNIAIEVGQIFETALTNLNVNATSVSSDFYDYINRLYYHGDYDMVFLGSSFSSFDVDWLAYEFWSEYADESYWNFPNFRNATYDSWRDQLLYSTNYDDVYEAAIEMQKILVYESPVIICYENLINYAHRDDRFTGFIRDVLNGPVNFMTNLNVRMKSGSGGTFRISIGQSIDTFNFMTTSSKSTLNILENLYCSLFRQVPNGDLEPWIAKSVYIETHDDNSEVPEGHMRINIEIFDNYSWSDGNPLTAYDVAFSMNYYKEGAGNPYGVDLARMTIAQALTKTKLYFEFEQESYWNLNIIALKPIIPRHVFIDIGADKWSTWDPNPPSDNMVVSGGFIISDYRPDEYVELVPNPTYFIGPSEMMVAEDKGFSITWNALSGFDMSYIIWLNDSLIEAAGIDATGTITFTSEGLNPGVYNLTIQMFGLNGQFISRTTWIQVIADPFIEAPSTFVFVYGTTGNYISWHVWGDLLLNYTIWIDGEILESGAIFEASNITIGVDNLTAGTHNVTLQVLNQVGGSAVNEVIVDVTRPAFPFPTLGISEIITIGSLIVIVVFGSLIIKSRR